MRMNDKKKIGIGEEMAYATMFRCHYTFHPDLIFVTADRKIFALELKVSFETNLNINAQRKKAKYEQLLQTLSSQFYSGKM